MLNTHICLFVGNSRCYISIGLTEKGHKRGIRSVSV